MNRKEPKQIGLSESRFISMVFLFKMAGILVHIDYLQCVRDNSDYMCFQYIYWHVRRCVHTLGRFGTRHDVNACVDSVHECYLGTFLLQVSSNTGCHSRSIANIKKNHPKYIIEVLI
jgi:hypothetical protein